jgi:DNA polymerase-3 subunit delta'
MAYNYKQYQKQYTWPQIGNDNLMDFLDSCIASQKLAQTYVFAGPEDLGKSTIALAFANNLILSDGQETRDFSSVNSDLHILSREAGKKNISIEAVRDFIKMLSLSSFLNSYKIGIIKEAETLSTEAASALLKTLEEPRDKVIIILLTSSVDLLMPTIVSRSQVLYFYPVPFEIVYDYLVKELNLKRGDAKDMAALSAGRPLLAARFAENPAVYERHLEIARIFLSFFNFSIPERLKILNSFLTKDDGSLTVDKASEILEIWQRAARDLSLSVMDLPELVQHTALSEELGRVNASFSAANNEAALRYYSKILELLNMLRRYLSANVVPNAVLEQVVYNL